MILRGIFSVPKEKVILFTICFTVNFLEFITPSKILRPTKNGQIVIEPVSQLNGFDSKFYMLH